MCECLCVCVSTYLENNSSDLLHTWLGALLGTQGSAVLNFVQLIFFLRYFLGITVLYLWQDSLDMKGEREGELHAVKGRRAEQNPRAMRHPLYSYKF